VRAVLVEPKTLSHGASMDDDKRLERLFDYTKFHIGIYVSAGGALVALIGVAAQYPNTVKQGIGSPRALVYAVAAMALAGLGGGVITSATTQHVSFQDVWNKQQGPLKLFRGKTWARIEHYSFWLSLGLFTYAILTAPKVRDWLCP
jgi:hypothetical protein